MQLFTCQFTTVNIKIKIIIINKLQKVSTSYQKCRHNFVHARYSLFFKTDSQSIINIKNSLMNVKLMKQAYTILLKKYLNDGKAIFKATCLIHVNNTEIKRNHSNIGHSLHKPINNILCVSLSLLNIKHIQLQTFSAIQSKVHISQGEKG